MNINREGKLTPKDDPRLLYAGMLATRLKIASTIYRPLSNALLIAIRYSAVRRQFKNISGQDLETKILDYQTQQMKLFPIVAMMFAMGCGANYLQKKGKEMMNNIENKDFSLLPLLHHYSSGMKTVYTQD